MISVVMLLVVLSDSPQSARADRPPLDTYDDVAFLQGDLAAAISIASLRVLTSQKKPKTCYDELRSYNVHASRESDTITVVFLPNKRCGSGIKGGGGRVTMDAKTLKVLSVSGYE